jgi:hypothetical protein
MDMLRPDHCTVLQTIEDLQLEAFLNREALSISKRLLSAKLSHNPGAIGPRNRHSSSNHSTAVRRIRRGHLWIMREWEQEPED